MATLENNTANLTVKQAAEQSGLTEGQIRYALNKGYLDREDATGINGKTVTGINADQIASYAEARNDLGVAPREFGDHIAKQVEILENPDFIDTSITDALESSGVNDKFFDQKIPAPAPENTQPDAPAANDDDAIKADSDIEKQIDANKFYTIVDDKAAAVPSDNAQTGQEVKTSISVDPNPRMEDTQPADDGVSTAAAVAVFSAAAGSIALAKHWRKAAFVALTTTAISIATMFSTSSAPKVAKNNDADLDKGPKITHVDQAEKTVKAEAEPVADVKATEEAPVVEEAPTVADVDGDDSLYAAVLKDQEKEETKTPEQTIEDALAQHKADEAAKKSQEALAKLKAEEKAAQDLEKTLAKHKAEAEAKKQATVVVANDTDTSSDDTDTAGTDNDIEPVAVKTVVAAAPVAVVTQFKTAAPVAKEVPTGSDGDINADTPEETAINVKEVKQQDPEITKLEEELAQVNEDINAASGQSNDNTEENDQNNVSSSASNETVTPITPKKKVEEGFGGSIYAGHDTYTDFKDNGERKSLSRSGLDVNYGIKLGSNKHINIRTGANFGQTDQQFKNLALGTTAVDFITKHAGGSIFYTPVEGFSNNNITSMERILYGDASHKIAQTSGNAIGLSLYKDFNESTRLTAILFKNVDLSGDDLFDSENTAKYGARLILDHKMQSGDYEGFVKLGLAYIAHDGTVGNEGKNSSKQIVDPNNPFSVVQDPVTGEFTFPANFITINDSSSKAIKAADEELQAMFEARGIKHNFLGKSGLSLAFGVLGYYTANADGNDRNDGFGFDTNATLAKKFNDKITGYLRTGLGYSGTYRANDNENTLSGNAALGGIYQINKNLSVSGELRYDRSITGGEKETSAAVSLNYSF